MNTGTGVSQMSVLSPREVYRATRMGLGLRPVVARAVRVELRSVSEAPRVFSNSLECTSSGGS